MTEYSSRLLQFPQTKASSSPDSAWTAYWYLYSRRDRTPRSLEDASQKAYRSRRTDQRSLYFWSVYPIWLSYFSSTISIAFSLPFGVFSKLCQLPWSHLCQLSFLGSTPQFLTGFWWSWWCLWHRDLPWANQVNSFDASCSLRFCWGASGCHAHFIHSEPQSI